MRSQAARRPTRPWRTARSQTQGPIPTPRRMAAPPTPLKTQPRTAPGAAQTRRLSIRRRRQKATIASPSIPASFAKQRRPSAHRRPTCRPTRCCARMRRSTSGSTPSSPTRRVMVDGFRLSASQLLRVGSGACLWTSAILRPKCRHRTRRWSGTTCGRRRWSPVSRSGSACTAGLLPGTIRPSTRSPLSRTKATR